MKSSNVSPGQSGLAAQYNNLRSDAYGGSQLLAHQQGTPNMTLYVEPGVVYIGTTRVIFGGGNSTTITAPTSHPRIDILTIDSTGTLAITQGTEASSPVVPSYPANKAVLCEIYNRVGETSVKDADDSTNGYIYNDVRPFIAPVYISSTSQFGSAVVPDTALVSDFVHDPGSDAQGDILYRSASAWARLPAGTAGQALLTQGTGANPTWAIPQAFTVTTIGGGGSVLQDATNSEGTTNTTPTKVKTLTCNVAGLYTFNVSCQNPNSVNTSHCALYKNGVQVGTTLNFSQNSGYVRGSFGDFSAAASDYFDLYIWTANSSYGVSVNSYQVLGQNGLQFVVGATTFGFIPTLIEGSFAAVPTSNWSITLN